MGKRKKRGSRKRRKAMAARAKAAEEKRKSSASADDESEQDDLESAAERDDDDDSRPERSGAADDEGDGAPDSGGEPPDDGVPSSGSAPRSRRPDGREWPRWVQRVVAFERGWSWLESRLMFIALMVLMVVLCVWISLNGMSSPLATPNKAGVVFRAIVGAVLLGGGLRLLIRKREMPRWQRSVATGIAVLIGLGVAPLWRSVGIGYFGGLLDWAQEGSTITLIGGLRGVGTRLTILVALLGGSLAAASARHINIDVVVRFLTPRLRLPVAVLGGIATAAVCFVASWGLLDYLAIDGFHAEREATPSAKIAHIQDTLGEHSFILRKQLGLDVRALPTVLAGTRWDAESRMNGRRWNAWVESAGFRDHYSKEQVDGMLAPQEALDEPRLPFVVVPGGSPRSLLVPAMDLTYPFGFFMIGLRVLLRVLLLLVGYVLPFQAGGDEEYGYASLKTKPARGVAPDDAVGSAAADATDAADDANERGDAAEEDDDAAEEDDAAEQDDDAGEEDDADEEDDDATQSPDDGDGEDEAVDDSPDDDESKRGEEVS